jgi:hypothetical protein
MYFFATLQHRHEFNDLARPRLRLFDGADAIQDRKAVSAVQRRKECGGLPVFV